MSDKARQANYDVSSIDRAVNGTINFIFYYRLLIVFLALAVLSFITYKVWTHPDPSERFKSISLVFSFGSIVIGIFYAILNYEHSHIKYKKDTKWAKNTLSFNTASQWHSPSMVNNLKTIKLLYNKHKSLLDAGKAVDFFNILEDNEDGRSALVSVFNFMELIALGIDAGLLDRYFLKKYFEAVFKGYYSNYRFYIDHRRRVNNEPTTWIAYTNLTEKWLA